LGKPRGEACKPRLSPDDECRESPLYVERHEHVTTLIDGKFALLNREMSCQYPVRELGVHEEKPQQELARATSLCHGPRHHYAVGRHCQSLFTVELGGERARR
jgi:hypothetical protein